GGFGKPRRRALRFAPWAQRSWRQRRSNPYLPRGSSRGGEARLLRGPRDPSPCAGEAVSTVNAATATEEISSSASIGRVSPTHFARGTGGSNPVSSRAESAAN